MKIFGIPNRKEYLHLEKEQINALVKLSHSLFESLDFHYKDIDFEKILRCKLAGYTGRLSLILSLFFLSDHTPNKKSIIPQLKDIIDPNCASRSNIAKFADKIIRLYFNKYYLSPTYERIEVPLQAQWQKNVIKTGEDTTNKTIMYTGSMAQYINPIRPVLKEYLENGYNVIAMMPDKGKEWIQWKTLSQFDNFFPYFISDFFDKEMQSLFNEYQKELIDIYKSKKNLLIRSLEYKYASVFPYIELGVENIITNYIPHCIIYYEIARKLSTMFNMKLFLFSRLRRAFELTFLNFAQNNNIRTAGVLHGHLTFQSGYYWTLGYFDETDNYFLWNKQQKEAILDGYENINPEKLCVVGNAQWDNIWRYKENAIVENNKTKLPDFFDFRDKNIVLLLSQASHWQTITTMNALKPLSDTVLIIKLHPREKIADCKNYQNLKNVVIFDDNNAARLTTHDFIGLSDLVVVGFSTTNIESVLIGTPVILLGSKTQLDNAIPFKSEFEKMGVPFVLSAKELSKIVKSYFSNEQYKQKLKESIKAMQPLIVPNYKGKSALSQIVDKLDKLMLHK